LREQFDYWIKILGPGPEKKNYSDPGPGLGIPAAPYDGHFVAGAMINLIVITNDEGLETNQKNL
jgi:hypothetical protein